jgi:hypothetical protein
MAKRKETESEIDLTEMKMEPDWASHWLEDQFLVEVKVALVSR